MDNSSNDQDLFIDKLNILLLILLFFNNSCLITSEIVDEAIKSFLINGLDLIIIFLYLK